MMVVKPDYYDKFHCIADKCGHTCCASWEIDIDKKTYEYYKQVEGTFGEQLRQGISTKKQPHIQMKHGFCPFLSKEHLCEVYQTLGEEAMCEVCKEYPRTYEQNGNTREMVLVLSCEEAARLLFSERQVIKFNIENTDINNEADALRKENSHYSQQSDIILEARNQSIHLLQDRTFPLTERITYFLEFSKKVQLYIDKRNQILQSDNQSRKTDDQEQKSENKSQLKELLRQTMAIPAGKVNDMQRHAFFQKRMDIMMGMEVMEEEWNEESNNVMRAFYADSQAKTYAKVSQDFKPYTIEHSYEYEHIMVYFAYRYLIRALEDERFDMYARFCVLSYLVILDLDRMRYLIHGNRFTFEDRIETVRIYCKQTEHSQRCIDYLMAHINMLSEEELEV